MGRPSTLALSNSLTAFSAKEAVLEYCAHLNRNSQEREKKILQRCSLDNHHINTDLKVAKAVPSERLVSLLRWMITFTTWKFKKEQRLVTT
jgi:hypothetical protein